jgi:hypothetical protein
MVTYAHQFYLSFLCVAQQAIANNFYIMYKNNIIQLATTLERFLGKENISIPAYGAVFHAIVFAARTNCSWKAGLYSGHLKGINKSF